MMSLRHSLFAVGLSLSVCLGGSFSILQPVTAQTLRPELRIGSAGAIVGELQATLRLLGYYSGEATGTYDEATVIAVYQFQKAANIPQTGIMDQRTWTTLFPIAAATTTAPTATTPTAKEPPKTTTTTTPPTAKPPATTSNTTPNTSFPKPETLPLLREAMEGESVSLLQRRLKTLGYYAGAIDGVFGRQTLLAVIEAQKAFKLDADGIVGVQTWKKLLE